MAKPAVGVEQGGDGKRVYYGVIVEPIDTRRENVLWYCQHHHSEKNDARRCAETAFRRRTSVHFDAPVSAP